ncbi:hypothetical protein ATO49_25600 [Mycolicibacterium fortuitum subsp. fortuitum DSM 46621 = ATCC 6841 = JCM 6387]|nr:hypothetical protein ATO49_25600 [Mycolicibacterium fortuitum subsp. fortuitum DSM 46621 = ATCC 6841 = JCM 6387]
MFGSARPPETSLTICAPFSSATFATSACMVSMLTVIPWAASASITGATRAASTEGSTRTAPGRVDSPPTSMIAAPAAARASPCSTARSRSMNLPPSEKESSVTFTTPMTCTGVGFTSEG